MKHARKILVLAIINGALISSGPLLYGAYSYYVGLYPERALNLFSRVDSIGVMLASSAFTMLGFLAAVITIMFSFSQSKSFIRYKKEGYLGIFFSVYYAAIFCLMLTFGLSLLSLGASARPALMHLAIIFATISTVQMVAMLVAIINLSRRLD